MRHLYLIVIFLFIISNFAYADDKSYPAPNILKDCKIDSNNWLTCNFDNTFVKLYSYSTSGGSVSGDYYFTYANATPFSESWGTDWGIIYNYVNPNNGNFIKIEAGFSSVITPDFNMPGTHWYKYDSSTWLCDYKSSNPDSSFCTFTHTPWTQIVNALEIKPHSLGKLTYKNNEAKRTYKKHTPLDATSSSKGRILYTNNTDYPLTVHVDDYNTAYINLTSPVVPPHTINMVVGTYQIDTAAGQELHYDCEIGPGDRNALNTALVAWNSQALMYVYKVSLDDKYYYIWEVLGSEPGDIAFSAEPENNAKNT